MWLSAFDQVFGVHFTRCPLFELGENDGDEDEGAAEDLQGDEGFVQEQPAGEDGEDGFEAEDEGGVGGRGVALRPDLEGVAKPEGEYGGVGNGKQERGVRREGGFEEYANAEV